LEERIHFPSAKETQYPQTGQNVRRAEVPEQGDNPPRKFEREQRGHRGAWGEDKHLTSTFVGGREGSKYTWGEKEVSVFPLVL